MIARLFARAPNWRKYLLVLILLALTTGGAVLGWRWYNEPDWSVLDVAATASGNVAAAPSTEPSAVVKQVRDYGHRTGDLVHLDLYLRQPAGTQIELATLSVTGDFELPNKPSVAQKALPDGSVLYRLKVDAQGFTVGQSQTFVGSVGWKSSGKDGDKRGELTLPATKVYTSLTYDGRDALQEGADPRVSVYWYGARHVVPLVLSLVVYLLLLVPAIKAYLRSRIKPVVIDHARLRVLDLVALIKSGSAGKADHLELDGLIRQRYKIASVPVSQLDKRLVPDWLMQFLRQNEPAVYAQEALQQDDRERLLVQAEIILRHWN